MQRERPCGSTLRMEIKDNADCLISDTRYKKLSKYRRFGLSNLNKKSIEFAQTYLILSWSVMQAILESA